MTPSQRGLRVNWRGIGDNQMGLWACWGGLWASWRGLKASWRSLGNSWRGRRPSWRGQRPSWRGLISSWRGLRASWRGLKASWRGPRPRQRSEGQLGPGKMTELEPLGFRLCLSISWMGLRTSLKGGINNSPQSTSHGSKRILQQTQFRLLPQRSHLLRIYTSRTTPGHRLPL